MTVGRRPGTADPWRPRHQPGPLFCLRHRCRAKAICGG